MKKTELPLSEVYRVLEPGPVVLLTTAYKGQPNVMTMSWHMMMEFEPPTFACILSNRDHSYEILRKTKECALNIPTAEIAKQVVGCGNTSGATTDKFRKFRLTPVPATCVKAPLIAECYASLECKVVDMSMVNKYGMFILEVVKAWSDRSVKNPRTLHHRGRGYFMIAGETVKLPSRMK